MTMEQGINMVWTGTIFIATLITLCIIKIISSAFMKCDLDRNRDLLYSFIYRYEAL